MDSWSIKDIKKHYMKKVIVLGASLDSSRYSNMAMKKLKLKDYDIIGIGSRTGEVVGVPILTEPILINDIHTVTIYLNPMNQRSYYDYVFETRPKRVIFNPGSENKEFEMLLDQQQISFEKACTLVMLSLNQF